MEFYNNLDPSKKYVIDRAHLGGMVYGPVYRNGPELTDEKFRNLNLNHCFFGIYIYFCNSCKSYCFASYISTSKSRIPTTCFRDFFSIEIPILY